MGILSDFNFSLQAWGKQNYIEKLNHWPIFKNHKQIFMLKFTSVGKTNKTHICKQTLPTKITIKTNKTQTHQTVWFKSGQRTWVDIFPKENTQIVKMMAKKVLSITNR